MLIAPAPPPAPAERLSVGLHGGLKQSAAIAASTVMFPVWVPVGFDVVTVTLVPPASAEVIAATLSVELSAVGVQTTGKPPQLTFNVVEVMSILESGSSSHCPAVP